MTDATATPTLETIEAGTAVKGVVRQLTLYGAMVDIGLEQEALLHRSELGDTNLRNVEDVLPPGTEVEAYVMKVDRDNGRIVLTTVKPPALPWEKIRNGETYQGEVIRIERFGAFVDIGAERPGMVHVSELTDGYVSSPDDVVSVGQMVDVRVIKLNRKQRKIDLSMKTPKEEFQAILEPEEDIPTAMELALRKVMDDDDMRGELPKREQRRRTNKKKKSRRGDGGYQDDIIERTLRNRDDYS